MSEQGVAVGAAIQGNERNGTCGVGKANRRRATRTRNNMNRRTTRNRKIRNKMHALQYPAAMLRTCRLVPLVNGVVHGFVHGLVHEK